MPTQLRLLLLSAGSLTAQNIFDALGARRERCVLIGTNSIADAAGNFRCDTAYLAPPAAHAGYIARVREVIEREHPDLVIPTRDDDVLALAMLAEQSPEIRAKLLTGTVAAARIMNDKVETARFAARHALPFAPTVAHVRDALALARTYGLPLIGKPRSGNASHGVVLLRSNSEIERAFAYSPDLIAQPFLDPPSDIDALIAPFENGLPFFFSFPKARVSFVHVIVGPDGEVSRPFGGVATQTGGQATWTAPCGDAGLLDVGRAYGRAAAAEGWRGPLNIQLKHPKDTAPIAFELNGRFGGGTSARACLGFDDIAEVVNRFVPGVRFPVLPAPDAESVQKYLYTYPVPRAAATALRATGRWSRS